MLVMTMMYDGEVLTSGFMVKLMMIIMFYNPGWDTCVPTPKNGLFQRFKAFLFLKYF